MMADTMTHSPLISVIIVNYNSGARLKRCLEALSVQTRPAFEVFVIDNASSDQSLDTARAFDVNIIEAGDNLGFAAANNKVAAQAKGDWLAFLNPDAYPRADWLEVIAAAIEKYTEYDAFGSLQINADDPNVLDGAGDVFHGSGTPYRGHFGWPTDEAPPDGECFSPCAAAAVYRKETFEKLGGFEESFFCYCEDIDLGYRLRLSGGRALQLREAAVLHEGSGVTGRRSEFSIYYGHRNRIWTHIRNTPASIFLLSLPYHLLTDIALFFYFLRIGRSGPYLRAIRDAIFGARTQFVARREIQANRKMSAAEIFQMFTWSPMAFWRRRADVRPISGQQ